MASKWRHLKCWESEVKNIWGKDLDYELDCTLVYSRDGFFRSRSNLIYFPQNSSLMSIVDGALKPAAHTINFAGDFTL